MGVITVITAEGGVSMAGSPGGWNGGCYPHTKSLRNKSKNHLFAKKDYGVVIEDNDAYRIVEKGHK